MTNIADFMGRTTAGLTGLVTRLSDIWSGTRHAHWLLRLPLALVLLQYGFDKFPLSSDVAAGWGLPLWLWALAGIGEVAFGVLLVVSGLIRGQAGDVLSRVSAIAAAAIIAGVIVVAYWAPPLDLLMFNQFHILLLGCALYLAFAPQTR
ncbi:MAG: hypothetical protein ACXIU7_10875 [Roseinatronobacter sp.]